MQNLCCVFSVIFNISSKKTLKVLTKNGIILSNFLYGVVLMKDKDKLGQLLENNDNNPMALHKIAVIYRDMKDYKKAEEYFIKAKQAGHYSAQFDLEELYARLSES